MLVVMQHDATTKDVDRVVSIIEEMGYEARPMPGAQRTAVGLVGNDGRVDASRLEALPGVAQIIHVTQPYKQVSREWRSENTVVELAPGVTVGGESVLVIGGPCSVESEEQILSAARIVKAAGGNALRGGAFKPRSSPYSFQGLGKKGLELLARAGKAAGLPIVTEAMDSEGAQMVAELADCIQIGARNMQNYSLLKTVGKMKKPVLLKRGMAATINDLLLSAEYILAEGNESIILCERGVRSFDPAARNMFDRNRTLWCGYVIEAAGRSVYFAADTAFGEHFAQIRERYGAPRVALRPEVLERVRKHLVEGGRERRLAVPRVASAAPSNERCAGHDDDREDDRPDH